MVAGSLAGKTHLAARGGLCCIGNLDHGPVPIPRDFSARRFESFARLLLSRWESYGPNIQNRMWN
jgi:hypothetical protein